MERLPYIDGIKGIAIVSVILLHAFPNPFLHQSFAYVHIWQAIPLFVFVSFFLIFKKMDNTTVREYFRLHRWKALFKRIILPFMLFELIIITILICVGNWEEIKHVIIVGGVGKGSYYPYLYCQIWLFTPFIYCLLKKNKYAGGVILLLLTIFLNYILVDKPERIYSCLFVRYLFMSFIAYMWYINRNINKRNLLWLFILPLISIVYWILLETKVINLSSIVPNWETQQFPSFFYTYLFIYLFTVIYSRTGKSIIKTCIEWLGNNSYEIFLMQMLFFYLFPQNKINIENNLLSMNILYPVFALIGSIAPVFVYRLFLNYITNKSSGCD